MHVAFLCNEYPPYTHGGVGTFTQTLARALVRSGCQVSVVGVYKCRADLVEEDQGVKVYRLAHSTIRGTGFFVNSA